MFRFLSIVLLGTLAVKIVLAIVTGIRLGLSEDKTFNESGAASSSTVSAGSSVSAISKVWNTLKFLSIPLFVVYLLGLAFIHVSVSEGKDIWMAKLSSAYLGAKLEGRCDGIGVFKLSGELPASPVRLASMPANIVKIDMSSPSLSCIYFAPFTAANRNLAAEFIDAKLKEVNATNSEEFYKKVHSQLDERIQEASEQAASRPATVPAIPKPVSKQLLQQSISGQ